MLYNSFYNPDFFTAVQKNDIPAVQAALLKGVSPNIIDSENSSITPLMTAAACGYNAMVKLLLKHNADAKLTDKRGFTALHFAQNAEIVNRLLHAGAAINAQKNLYKITPLIAAAHDGKSDIVFALIKAGANIRASDINGRTALMEAAYCTDKPTVRLLITKGAAVNQPDLKGQTALFDAAAFGRKGIIAELLKNGAKINVQDNNGNTPLMKAALYADASTIRMLLDHHADAYIKNQAGETAFDLLSSNLDRKVIMKDKLLIARLKGEKVAQSVIKNPYTHRSHER